MNIRMLATMFGISTRAFVAGWIEGQARYQADGSPSIVPGSAHRPGSVEFAASQAAVAYYIGREGK